LIQVFRLLCLGFLSSGLHEEASVKARMRWWLGVWVLISCFGVVGAAEPWPVLQVSPEALSRYNVVDELRFAGQGWMQIEQANAELAVVDVGHFEGAPTGLFGREVRIHHRSYVLPADKERGAAVIVPGFTEGQIIYQEVVHDLLQNGWSVYIHDHRNQGFSTRLIEGGDGRDKGHVDQFDRLVSDLDQQIDRVHRSRAGHPQRADRPIVLLAHSMGAAVSALHLARQGERTPIRSAVFVTPMMEPTVAPAESGRWGDRALRRWCHEADMPFFFDWPPLATLRVQGGTFDQEWRRYREMLDRKAHVQTHSVVRHDVRWLNRASSCEGEHCGHGDAKVAGATMGWVVQACSGAAEARGPGAARITVPVMVLQGEQDVVVEPEAQREFCDNVNLGKTTDQRGRCTGWQLPGARHGLLVEIDRLRRPALIATLRFWDASTSDSR
jgi:lysophospholipase